MPVSLYDVLWIFIIYSFLGWCTEVIYAGIQSGKFVNRGFLNGPLCPIYGVGVFSVIEILYPNRGNIVFLFFGSVLLTSFIEYITGYILEKVFRNRWWNYSNNKYNIHGYICLKFSIVWGVVCVLIIDIVHPVIYMFIKYMPNVFGIILLSIILFTYVIDLCVTVATILKFNQRLEAIDMLSQKLHTMSDEIGESLFDNVVEAVELKEKFQDNHKELIEEISEKKRTFIENMDYVKTAVSMMNPRHFVKNGKDTKEKLLQNIEIKKKEYIKLSNEYMTLVEEQRFGFNRLLNAFPNMKSLKNNEMLLKMKSAYKRSTDLIKKRKKKENIKNNAEN